MNKTEKEINDILEKLDEFEKTIIAMIDDTLKYREMWRVKDE